MHNCHFVGKNLDFVNKRILAEIEDIDRKNLKKHQFSSKKSQIGIFSRSNYLNRVHQPLKPIFNTS